MRVLKFDQQELAALRALGFEIAADNESAETDARVGFIKPADTGELLQIDLPGGETLACDLSRTYILQAASADDLSE